MADGGWRAGGADEAEFFGEGCVDSETAVGGEEGGEEVEGVGLAG